MLAKYEDILKRIKEEPKWFDSNGVPRYDKFSPELSPNIYADEVVLLKIMCQQCNKIFFVEMNWDKADKFLFEKPALSEMVKQKTIHYGDPPRHNDCGAGNTMNSIPLRVMQFWKRNENLDWIRIKELEIDLSCKKGGE